MSIRNQNFSLQNFGKETKVRQGEGWAHGRKWHCLLAGRGGDLCRRALACFVGIALLGLGGRKGSEIMPESSGTWKALPEFRELCGRSANFMPAPSIPSDAGHLSTVNETLPSICDAQLLVQASSMHAAREAHCSQTPLTAITCCFILFGARQVAIPLTQRFPCYYNNQQATVSPFTGDTFAQAPILGSRRCPSPHACARFRSSSVASSKTASSEFSF